MDFGSAVRSIENMLMQLELSFAKIVNQSTVVFDNIQIGDKTVVVVMPEALHIIIKLSSNKTMKKMRSICHSIERSYNVPCNTKSKGKIKVFDLRIDIENNPKYWDTRFFNILVLLKKHFGREISPFVLGIVTGNPDEFFIEQYKLWKAIPSEEQSQMFEDILVIKEKYFRTTKTKKGIVAKLNKLKFMLAKENKEIEDKQLLRIAFGEDFTGSFEFYYIDFAALFRAIELGLVRLKLTDFFENFNKKGGNR